MPTMIMIMIMMHTQATHARSNSTFLFLPGRAPSFHTQAGAMALWYHIMQCDKLSLMPD